MKALAIISLFFCLQACASSECIKNKKTFPSLDTVYKSGEFRIYYSMDSESFDYLSNQTDLNMNGVPDIIENIAIQANSTTEALDQLGYIHPLKSDRYINKAKFIDIHLIKMKGNGIAAENAFTYIKQKNKENSCSLSISIRNTIDFPGYYWTIVNHELFHLYQYSYTQFKGGWYLEGMTNTMERLLKRGAQGGSHKGKKLLPATFEELESTVYKVSYNDLWARLSILSDQTDGKLNLPDSILNRTYIDGSKVFKDNNLKGHLFIRTVLERMGEMTDKISEQNSWDRHHWHELDQISPDNRPYMLKVIQQTMLDFGLDQTSEQITFLKLN